MNVSILGGGSWGTALGLTALKAGMGACLWARSEVQVADMIKTGENVKLPGVTLPKTLEITSDLEKACSAPILFLVVPAQTIREMVRNIAPLLKKPTILVVCAKGIELTTGKFLEDVVGEEAPGHGIAILSGPSFAGETALGLPTAVTIAALDLEDAKRVAATLAHKTFRPYTSTDTKGVQIGGALKNVIAIATGAMDGRNLGQNCRALTITRGLAEITRLGQRAGANFETFYGLSGIGDLTLTCSSPLSRNFRLGYEVGKAHSAQHVLDSIGYLAEGVPTTSAALDLARRLGVEMPITQGIFEVLYKGVPLENVMEGLFDRPLKVEGM